MGSDPMPRFGGSPLAMNHDSRIHFFPCFSNKTCMSCQDSQLQTWFIIAMNWGHRCHETAWLLLTLCTLAAGCDVNLGTRLLLGALNAIWSYKGTLLVDYSSFCVLWFMCFFNFRYYWQFLLALKSVQVWFYSYWILRAQLDYEHAKGMAHCMKHNPCVGCSSPEQCKTLQKNFGKNWWVFQPPTAAWLYTDYVSITYPETDHISTSFVIKTADGLYIGHWSRKTGQSLFWSRRDVATQKPW